ncbi:MAG: RNA polymerase sigma factor [Bacillota bacterium]|jgi:RNA polymerase sigma-70 factor (ECF subfamily)
MINLPDEALVTEVLNGNDDAFRVLIEKYQKPIFNMAFRMCGDYDEAADLAQEAFLQIYRALDKYDSDKKFFSWMYRVSHNICVNVLNKKPKNTVSMDEVQENRLYNEDSLAQPEKYYSNRELRASIDAAILNLPDTYHDVIYLRFVNNLSYQEIADAMGLPISTIETRIYRGKALLQKELKEYAERRQ